MTFTAEVVGEDECVMADLMTIKIRVDFLNVQKGSKSGYAHSKHYPFLKRDQWFLIISFPWPLGLYVVEKLVITDNFFEKTIKKKLERKGELTITANLANDSFIGLDQQATAVLKIAEQAVNRVKP